MSRWSKKRLSPADWTTTVETQSLPVQFARASRHTICYHCQMPVPQGDRDEFRGEPVHAKCRRVLEGRR